MLVLVDAGQPAGGDHCRRVRERGVAGCEIVEVEDQRVVMDMLGWMSPTMTARYQYVVPELVEEANRRMSELLWGASGELVGSPLA